MRNVIKTAVALMLLSSVSTKADSGDMNICWPEAPADCRVSYLDEIHFSELSPAGGFFKKIVRLIGGGAESDKLSLPFDLIRSGDKLFVVCQNIPALIEVDPKDMTFKMHNCKEKPFEYPVSLCGGGDGTIFISDSKTNAVYRYSDGKIKLFIDSGLGRPTGLAAIADAKQLYVVDTGEQNVKLFDYDGKLLSVIATPTDSTALFNYPTFATITKQNQLLVNDALNYRIRSFDETGRLLSSFGAEGDGPGRFARPKGIATDSDGHIYVVDNLFDNVQLFDPDGTILLAIGSAGQAPGQFWSPAGIDIFKDTIYIADTFNNRIQILYYRSEQ